ncbi:MAG: hypothetical protein IKA82_01655 [Clostridia bacterium]|nr:hypothetical protein [Clostridia bacterium]
MFKSSQYDTVMKRALMILAALLVVCFVLRMVACSVTKPEEDPKDSESESVSDEPTDEPTDSIQDSESDGDGESEQVPADSVILAPTEDAGQEYIDKIIFLGDSTTHTLDAFGKVPETQVWTGEAKTLALYTNIDQTKIVYPVTKELMTIGEAAAKAKPEYLVITLGLNGGVGDYFEERQFKVAYRKLINAIKENSPETRIILNNIFPVSSLIEGYKTINNPNINTANGWIYDLAEEFGLKYLNSRECLIDENGELRLDYSQPDGIHMQPAAADALLMYIRTHAYID